MLVARLVKSLPAMQETQVQLLGQEDPLEKEMATHSSILAWRILRTEEPGRLQSMGIKESPMCTKFPTGEKLAIAKDSVSSWDFSVSSSKS